MSRYRSYLYSSVRILELYKGEIPLAAFLRSYFAQHKKYGAKDRRHISSLCYYYFRLGRSASSPSIQDKIILGIFLCENEPSELMESVHPEWSSKMTEPLKNKLELVKEIIDPAEIFSWQPELSAEIDKEQFNQSFLIQPDLFLRVRPRVSKGVAAKLERSKLPYQLADENCIVLPNSTKVEEYFLPDKEVVIQDYNSQKVLNFLKDKLSDYETKEITAWDCCAASGGKSILLFDLLNQRVNLTISDIRPSIILNLHQRFKKAGIKKYNYFIADLINPDFKNSISQEHLDQLTPGVIICDVPCSGSGTWSRTPEQLVFFDSNKIDEYAATQKKIVSNAIPFLQAGGLFFYITCSVFKKENEEVVAFIKQQFNLDLLESKLLKGYDKKADNMFVAVFRK